MSSLNNKKEDCSYCLKMIQEKQKQPVKCLTYGRRFHAVSSCGKSFDTHDIAENSTNTCQNCLAYSLPFQTLDDLDYEFSF